MTERPIIFSEPMVRALLERRKTQTRRLLRQPMPDAPAMDAIHPNNRAKHPAPYFDAYCGARPTPANPLGMTDRWCWWTRDDRQCLPTIRVGYVPGDRLWVREKVACGACAPSKPSHWSASFWRREQGTPKNPNGLWYAADGLGPERPITERGPWTPSIHMPRWASRITLTVTAVRVQRLQDISAADAEAEGIQREDDGYSLDGNSSFYAPSAVASFAHLWRAIHGADAWDSNPFVVAITFTVSKETPP